MAKAIESLTTSRFHNLSDSTLADELGHADALLAPRPSAKPLRMNLGGAASQRSPAASSPSPQPSRSRVGSMSRR
jgi:hypothetical protein